MRWLSDSGNIKKASLPPSFLLWRNSPESFSNSKRIYTTPPHLYRPESQLLGAGANLFRRENTEATHHGPPCDFTCVTTERT